MSTVEGEQFLTADEAAERMRLNPRTVTAHARQGLIPAHKIGGVWRFLWSEIVAEKHKPRDPWAKPVRPLRRAS